MHTRSQSAKMNTLVFIPIIQTRSQKNKVSPLQVDEEVCQRRSKRISKMPKVNYADFDTENEVSINEVNISIDIDFDGASKSWMRNKRRIGNGCYEYK